MVYVQQMIDDLDEHDRQTEDEEIVPDLAVTTRYVLDEDMTVRRVHLTQAHAEDYDQAVADYREAGEVIGTAEIVENRSGRSAGSGRSRASLLSKEQVAEARAWAAEIGVEVSAGSRLPRTVELGYLAGDVVSVQQWDQQGRPRALPGALREYQRSQGL